jgi:hypothetical protein
MIIIIVTAVATSNLTRSSLNWLFNDAVSIDTHCMMTNECGAFGGMRIGRGNLIMPSLYSPFVGPWPFFQFLDPIHSR